MRMYGIGILQDLQLLIMNGTKRDNDEQPADNEVTKADWFKKAERPPTPDLDWSKRQQVDFRPPQTWIMINLCNAWGKASSVNLRSSRTPIILKDYFINKDLEYLKGGDISRRYSTSVPKTKAATYELKWIEDLVPELEERIIVVTRLTIMKKYDYGHLDEIEVRLKKTDCHSKAGGRSSIRCRKLPKEAQLLQSPEHSVIGTLDDVRSALNDIAKGIRMEYLPMRK
ncbi:hypothetical protein Tco_1401700 [Tanacetum coccineum]